jgi:predicted enzyme related to lactoylglutathione lyase
MPISQVRNITFDSHDPHAQATWWAQVIGGTLADDDFPGDPEASVIWPDGPGYPRLLFEQVPETKAIKNRMHLDLTPDTTRAEEVARLTALGATVIDDRTRPDGAGWVVLQDPEGNEFCVERSDAERAG